jgi:hypothetical protein
LWSLLKDSEEALEIGDILESEDGELRIFKYVGFEQAQWLIPEVKNSGTETIPVNTEPAASR